MSLRSRPYRDRAEEADVLSRLRAAEVPLVRVIDVAGSVSVRACIDAVERLPEVAAARAWAAHDRDRSRVVGFTVSGVVSRCYAASTDALEADSVPF